MSNTKLSKDIIREKNREYQTRWRANNKEKYNELQKKYMKKKFHCQCCDCCIIGNMSQHNKTKKHQLNKRIWELEHPEDEEKKH